MSRDITLVGHEGLEPPTSSMSFLDPAVRWCPLPAAQDIGHGSEHTRTAPKHSEHGMDTGLRAVPYSSDCFSSM